MRTHRHSARTSRPSLAAVATVAMLVALAGFPCATARPEGDGAAQPEVPAADPADNDVDGVDVEGTVAEVQRRLREDPALPRLTADEIRGLIQEVTADEAAQPQGGDGGNATSTTDGSNATSNSTERGDRSLVLVMSHSAANMSGERLQSLFTLPPVTWVVPDELLHHHQATAPSRTAVDVPGVGPRPAGAVPPNHRPSYQDLEPQLELENRQRLQWEEGATTRQTERPLIFNFFEDEDFIGSTRSSLELTTGHETPTTSNFQQDQRTTQYPEVYEDTSTHSHTTELMTEDIQRPVTGRAPGEASRVSGSVHHHKYKNQQRHAPLRGSVRRKKPVQSSSTQHSLGAVTDQSYFDQTPSENPYIYSETSTLTPTTTDPWTEDAVRPSTNRGNVAAQTAENFEITVGSYDTKQRITFQQGNLDVDSPAADIIFSEDWRPPLALKPHSEASITEVPSGHGRQTQTATSGSSSSTSTSTSTQRPFQEPPFYIRKKPTYITSESILASGGRPEGNLASFTNDGPVSHQSGGDASPPSAASALVGSGSQPHQQGHGQTAGPADRRATTTPSAGLAQRRPGSPGSRRRRPVHRKRPAEATSAAAGGGVQPFRPLNPALLDSLAPQPRPPLPGAAHMPQTAAPPTTTAAPTETPDLSAAAAALSPAVRELLQSLGLLDAPPPPPTAAPAPSGPPAPDPAPFRAFKPLPTSRAEPEEQDMRHLLHRFGLLDPAPPTRGRRRQKTLTQPPAAANETSGDDNASSGGSSSTTTSTTPLTLDAIDTSMLTDEMRAVLHSLGIAPGEGRVDEGPTTASTRQPTTSTSTTTTTTTTTARQPTTDSGAGSEDSTARQGPEHVFSPTALKHSEEETARLQAVLDSVRQFAATHLNVTQPASATSSPRGVQHTTAASPLAAGPDPISFQELLAEINGEESRKNEVKRQQPQDVNTTASTSAPEREVEEVTSRANRTAEDEARVQALSESFGGDSDSGDADYEEQEGGGEQAVQRPNGLYFLLDWNSFLRVGDPDSPRVNLRFSPRAGNPRNFLPVTVP